MANREGGNIYVIPQFADQGELEKLEISAPVIGMADAYERSSSCGEKFAVDLLLHTVFRWHQ